MESVVLPFGTVHVYPMHVETHMQHGVAIDIDEVEQLIDLIRSKFGESPYGYISVRDQAFSVNPLASRRVMEATKVRAAAFVVRTEMSRMATSTETMFYAGVPTLACSSIGEAEAFLAKHLA